MRDVSVRGEEGDGGVTEPRRIPLTDWAARRYDPVPSIHTLRRWAKDGKIVPVPEKHGREFRVLETARFIDTKDPAYIEKAAEAIHESQKAQHG